MYVTYKDGGVLKIGEIVAEVGEVGKNIFDEKFELWNVRRPPKSTQGVSSAASDVYKSQPHIF